MDIVLDRVSFAPSERPAALIAGDFEKSLCFGGGLTMEIDVVVVLLLLLLLFVERIDEMRLELSLSGI